MSQAKVLVSDYKKALINKNKRDNERFISIASELAFKIKSSRIWNYYYWIPLFKDSENEIIRRLLDNNWEYHEQLGRWDSIKLHCAYVDNDEFRNRIESLDLIKDDFIIVELETVKFINKWKNKEN